MDLSIRVWDNILAYGTRFVFNVALSILRALEHQLLDLSMEQLIKFFDSYWFDKYHHLIRDHDENANEN